MLTPNLITPCFLIWGVFPSKSGMIPQLNSGTPPHVKNLRGLEKNCPSLLGIRVAFQVHCFVGLSGRLRHDARGPGGREQSFSRQKLWTKHGAKANIRGAQAQALHLFDVGLEVWPGVEVPSALSYQSKLKTANPLKKKTTTEKPKNAKNM